VGTVVLGCGLQELEESAKFLGRGGAADFSGG
jgi:hypothetical protein